MERSYHFNRDKISFLDYIGALTYHLYTLQMKLNFPLVNNSNDVYYLKNDDGVFCSLSLDEEGNSFTVAYLDNGDPEIFFRGMDLLIQYINIQAEFIRPK